MILPPTIITVAYVDANGQDKERHYVERIGSPEAVASCELTMHGTSDADMFACVDGYYYSWCPTCNLLLASGPIMEAR